jgi:alanine racemase
MRAWLEVNLGVISDNYDLIRRHVGPKVGVIAVVKSDAYGHGIEPIAKLLDQKGVLAYAVISLEEAFQVRKSSRRPVLIMGYLDNQEIEQAIASGFILSLYDKDLAHIYERAAAKLGRKAIVHLKVETGLNRLGVSLDEAEHILFNPQFFPHLRVESVYSHLSSSSDANENQVQLARFQELLGTMRARDLKLPLHMANSYALPCFADGFFNAVRLGLALYGVDEVIPNLQPSLECKTVIIQRKKVKAGEGISYNKLFTAPRDMEVGVIGIGYAEGLTQALTGKANVLVNGVKTPILGQICMNLCVIDLTDIPGDRGTEVVVVGKQREQSIRVVDLAAAAGIRHHEILTRFGLALPRTYVNDPFTVVSERATFMPEAALVTT